MTTSKAEQTEIEEIRQFIEDQEYDSESIIDDVLFENEDDSHSNFAKYFGHKGDQYILARNIIHKYIKKVIILIKSIKPSN